MGKELKYKIGQEVTSLEKQEDEYETFYGKTGTITDIDEWDDELTYRVAFKNEEGDIVDYRWFNEINIKLADPRLLVKSIWKYELKHGDNDIMMPEDSIIISVIEQSNKIQMYALVPIYADKIEVNVVVVGTGHDASFLGGLTDHFDLGTVSTYGGSLIWHVFVEKNKKVKLAKYM